MVELSVCHLEILRVELKADKLELLSAVSMALWLVDQKDKQTVDLKVGHLV